LGVGGLPLIGHWDLEVAIYQRFLCASVTLWPKPFVSSVNSRKDKDGACT
jgi:hypothetical protein